MGVWLCLTKNFNLILKKIPSCFKPKFKLLCFFSSFLGPKHTHTHFKHWPMSECGHMWRMKRELKRKNIICRFFIFVRFKPPIYVLLVSFSGVQQHTLTKTHTHTHMCTPLHFE